ncbi:MAG: DUF3108 domain-containing protein [Nitrospira sp.]|nr:DUF3108 domain-containing protein [Nitrospira sp.]
MQRFIIKTILLFIMAGLLPSQAYSGTSEQISRKFIYHVYWAGIWAGTAVLSYESTPDGIAIRTHAETSPVIAMFYKVDDNAESILYPDGYPKSHVLKVRQGRHQRHKITTFERNPEVSTYRVNYHNVLNDEKARYDLDKMAYDALSGFYSLTRRELNVNKPIFIDIFDSNKLWNTEVQILRKEKMRVPAGEYDTIVVKPLMQSEGIFIKKGEILIWITDDDRRIPVFMKSKVKIGHFTVKLMQDDK